MNVIVENTKNEIDGLSVADLSEMANDAAANVETQMRSAVQNAIIAGRALIAAKSQIKHGEWLAWLKENWRFSANLASDYMRIANTQSSVNLQSAASISEALRMIADAKAEAKQTSEQTELDLVDDDVDVAVVDNSFLCVECSGAFDEPVWHCLNCNSHWPDGTNRCSQCDSGDSLSTKKLGELDDADLEYEDVEEEQDQDFSDQKSVPQFWSIAEWELLADEDKTHLFFSSEKTLNKQDTTSIEWAQWSWNPITGCKHDCPYCYARDIANRFYEKQKFNPTIYPNRFNAPKNTRLPDKAKDDTAFKNIFTGSMADIFGRWVPKEWINRTLGVVQECPDWNFLFLTKFPQRVHEFGELPANAWMGTTVDCQDRVTNAEKAFAKMGGGIKWLSIEPMLTPLKFTRLDLFDWVVIGGASKSNTTPAWVPPMDWIADLHQQARAAGCAIYYKDNLQMGTDLRLREFPWEPREQKTLPASMKYLNIK